MRYTVLYRYAPNPSVKKKEKNVLIIDHLANERLEQITPQGVARVVNHGRRSPGVARREGSLGASLGHEEGVLRTGRSRRSLGYLIHGDSF